MTAIVLPVVPARDQGSEYAFVCLDCAGEGPNDVEATWEHADPERASLECWCDRHLPDNAVEWPALQGLRVRADSDEYGSFEGIWDWHGQTGEDFFLVRILDDAGRTITGTDPRNFAAVTVLSPEDNGSEASQ